VFVIDDEEIARNVARGGLEQIWFSALTANDG
jgi:hypothetical protein